MQINQHMYKYIGHCRSLKPFYIVLQFYRKNIPKYVGRLVLHALSQTHGLETTHEMRNDEMMMRRMSII